MIGKLLKYYWKKFKLYVKLTTVLLALPELYQTLRQQCKATLHRLLYENSDSIVKENPDGADWLMNGMAAVAVLPPKEKYKIFRCNSKLLQTKICCMPKRFDNYM